MSEREQRLAIEAVADLFGAAVDWQPTRKGSHVRAVFVSKDKSAAIVFARNPRDWRAKMNNICLARRKLRELTQ